MSGVQRRRRSRGGSCYCSGVRRGASRDDTAEIGENAACYNEFLIKVALWPNRSLWIRFAAERIRFRPIGSASTTRSAHVARREFLMSSTRTLPKVPSETADTARPRSRASAKGPNDDSRRTISRARSAAIRSMFSAGRPAWAATSCSGVSDTRHSSSISHPRRAAADPKMIKRMGGSAHAPIRLLSHLGMPQPRYRPALS